MSLLAAIGALLVVSLATYGIARWYGSAISGSERAVWRLRRVLYVGLGVAGLLGLFAFVGEGGTDPVRASLGDGAVGDAVAMAAMTAAVFVADVALYLGLFPALRSARGVEYGTAAAVGRFGRWLAAFLATLAVGIYVVGHAGGAGTASTVGVGVVLIGVLYVASGYVVRVSQSTRDPTADERERIAAACETAGFDPRSVRVVESGETRWAGVLVRGPRGYRTLFVGSHLLDAYGDDALAVQVVARAARAARWYHEVRFAALLALGEAAVVGLVVLGPGLWGVAVLLGGLLAGGVLLWYGNRIVYAADADAAAATAPDVVAETYRAAAADADQSLDDGSRLGAFVRMRPTLASRIARLGEPTD